MNNREKEGIYYPGEEVAWQFVFLNLLFCFAVFTPKYLHEYDEPLGVKNNGYRTNTTHEIDSSVNANGTGK